MRVREAMEVERKAKEEEKAKHMVEHRRQVNNRGCAATTERDVQKQFDNSNESLFKPLKTLEEYEKIFAQNTEFFSTYNPDMIEDSLLDNLRQQGIEPFKNTKDRYKLKFTISTQDQGGTVNNVQI
jgi:hypothetical protein